MHQRNHGAKTEGFRGLEMTAFDATKPTLDASNSSPFTSSMPNCDEQVATSTRLPHALSCHGKAEGSLRDASERHDGEMFPAAAVLDAQLDHCTWSPSHERRRRRARGTSRPAQWQRERQPRDPEATNRGDRREVDVNDVVGSLRSHGSRLRRSAQSGFGLGGGWSIRRTVVAPR